MTTYTNFYNFPKPAFGAPSWHTDMYSFIDSVDALFSTFVSIADMQGPWQNSVVYTVGQTTLDTVSGGLYVVQVAHTSAASGTFSEARTANPTYWELSAYSANALAEKWADEDEDVAVETGKFSAKHWAAKASAAVGAFGGAAIFDTDEDTFVRTEQSADEDKVRIATGGTERVVIDASGLNATALLEGGTAIAALYADIAHESDTDVHHAVTAFVQTLFDDADAAAVRATLGLGPISVMSGGVAGNIAYASGADTWARLAKGTDGQVLALTSGLPSWIDADTGSAPAGLLLSNNVTDATNDIDIAVGIAASNGTDPVFMVLGTAITKRLDAAWAVGTNQGGLDTGSIADTTYHVWLIRRSDTGVVDVLFSASATSPTMPTDYTQKRRIGSILRVGSAIVPFVQTENEFRHVTPPIDVSVTSPGTSAVLRTLSVPAGIKAEVFGYVHINNGGAGVNNGRTWISDPATVDIDPATTLAHGLGCSNDNTIDINIEFRCRTNTSSQIRTRAASSSTSSGLILFTFGWIDNRARQAT